MDNWLRFAVGFLAWMALLAGMTAVFLGPLRARGGNAWFLTAVAWVWLGETLDAYSVAPPWLLHGTTRSFVVLGCIIAGFGMMLWPGLIQFFQHAGFLKPKGPTDG